jgi:hypothetical protein
MSRNRYDLVLGKEEQKEIVIRIKCKTNNEFKKFLESAISIVDVENPLSCGYGGSCSGGYSISIMPVKE